MKYIERCQLSGKQIEIATPLKKEVIVPRGCGKSSAILSLALDGCCSARNYKICIAKRYVEQSEYLYYCKQTEEYDSHFMLDQTLVVFFKTGSILVVTELCGKYGIICAKGSNINNSSNWIPKRYMDMGVFYDIIYFDDVDPYNVYKGSKEHLFETLDCYVKDKFMFVYTRNDDPDYEPDVIVSNANACMPYFIDWFKKHNQGVQYCGLFNVEDYRRFYQPGVLVKEGTFARLLYKEDSGNELCLIQDEIGNVWIINRYGLTPIKEGVGI